MNRCFDENVTMKGVEEAAQFKMAKMAATGKCEGYHLRKCGCGQWTVDEDRFDKCWRCRCKEVGKPRVEFK